MDEFSMVAMRYAFDKTLREAGAHLLFRPKPHERRRRGVAVDHPKARIEQHEWGKAVAKIKEERENSEEFNVNDVVQNLTHEQLAGVLNSIPQDELYKLLDRYKLI